MSAKTKSIIAFICSLWFLLLGWMWVYFFNIIFVFPIAILGFFLWRNGRSAPTTVLHKITGIVFLIGALVSVSAIFMYR